LLAHRRIGGKTMKTPKLILLAIIAAGAFGCAGSNSTTETTTSTTTTDAYPTLSASVANKTASINGTTGCITNVNTTMDSALPTRIKDNFKCQVAYVSGTNYIFKSANLPNTTSFYWAGKSEYDAGNSGQYALFAALPNGTGSANAAGTNVISSESLQLTIPATPTLKTGTLSGTQNGLVAIGLTLNGLAIFNNAAAPPDNLSTEALTFDGFDGHPQNTGIYHHHAGVRKVGISGTDNNDANLIGIALDGYLIYGKKCDNATAATGDDVTLTASVPALLTGNRRGISPAPRPDDPRSAARAHPEPPRFTWLPRPTTTTWHSTRRQRSTRCWARTFAVLCRHGFQLIIICRQIRDVFYQSER
jgi:hypothetical protein